MATSKPAPSGAVAVSSGKPKRVRNKISIPQLITDKFLTLSLIDKSHLVRNLTSHLDEHRSRVQKELQEAMDAVGFKSMPE